MSSKNVVWVVRAESREEEVCYFTMAFSDRATAEDICDIGQRDAGHYRWWIDPVALNDIDNAIKDIAQIMEV